MTGTIIRRRRAGRAPRTTASAQPAAPQIASVTIGVMAPVAAEVLDAAQQRDARSLRHDRVERRVEAGQQWLADGARRGGVAEITRNTSRLDATVPNAAATPVTAPATAMAYSHSAPNTCQVWPVSAPRTRRRTA